MTRPPAGNEASDRPQLDIDAVPTASGAEAVEAKAAAGIPSPGPAATAPGAPTVAAAPMSASTKPGVERWKIKTGTDVDVGKVKQQIVDTTVEELLAIERPGGAPTQSLDFEHRVGAAERTIWRIEADITLLKLEQDGDYHLVLRGDSGATLVGEVPDPRPAFVKPPSPWRSAIKQARATVDAQVTSNLTSVFVPVPIEAGAAGGGAPGGAAPGSAPTSGVTGGMTAGTSPQAEADVRPPVLLVPQSFPPAPAAAPGAAPTGPLVTPTDPNVPQPMFSTKIDARARITGVGFFDRVHGATGGAKNGIELHPILKIQFI